VLITPHPLVRVHFDEDSYFLRQWQLMVDSSQYLLVRHPGITQDSRGHARIHGRISVAHAALGNRTSALTHAARSIRLDPLRVRPWFAVALSARLISVDQASRLADLLRSLGPARNAAHAAWDRVRGRLERAAGVARRPAGLLARAGAPEAVSDAPAHIGGGGSGPTGLHTAGATPLSGGRAPRDHQPASSCAGPACGCAQPGARRCGPAA
jgi:hypothetical protein